MKDLSDIACAIAGPLTQRTMDNLRRWGEDMYIKSTAEGSTAEDQTAFSPVLIAQAHEAARLDNAQMIVSWAKAIYDALAGIGPDPYHDLKARLIYVLDQERFFRRELTDIEEGRAYPTLPPEERERHAASAQRAIQRAQEEIFILQEHLRGLRESQTEVPGRTPQTGAAGKVAPGRDDLDGHLPSMP